MADYTLTLSETEEKALETITASHNARMGTTFTPQEYFEMKAREYLNVLVNQYREAIKAQVEQKFNQMSPEQQAQFLAQLGIQI